jgi:SAM-dependent methyltransferase
MKLIPWLRSQVHPSRINMDRGNDLTETPLARQIEHFLNTVDLPDDGARAYLKEHMARIVRTLCMTPRPGGTGRVLELGAYMHMTPALQCVLGYREVRGAYYGKLGRSDKKVVTAGGKPVFECYVDLFDAEKDRYPYEDGRFDTVLACEIFEHFLHDPMHMLFECRRVLVDGGSIVLTTPNAVSYTAVERSLRMSWNPQVYPFYPNPHGEFADTEVGHMREYTPKELENALGCAGFEVDTLFTEIAPRYDAYLWVKEFLEKNNFPTEHRGEQMYCVAHKVPNAKLTRYPGFLYEV